ncbi:hypothetical protein SO802_025075 [Lithocarpus litseifolius]|uniref:Uncharacterized protein n=1 Tax=Lithocarpus litseifolius TaxID=425828 RepID=A0AAW2C185_9ROSI
MTLRPSRHLVLINGFSHQGPWYEGDSHLSYRDPHALADCWRNHANNKILDTLRDLWTNYHFIGSTGRISIFTAKPYFNAIPNIQRMGNHNPKRFIKRKPEYEPLVYCGFCNEYTTFSEHNCNYNPPWDYDGPPSEDCYDTS